MLLYGLPWFWYIQETVPAYWPTDWHVSLNLLPISTEYSWPFCWTSCIGIRLISGSPKGDDWDVHCGHGFKMAMHRWQPNEIIMPEFFLYVILTVNALSKIWFPPYSINSTLPPGMSTHSWSKHTRLGSCSPSNSLLPPVVPIDRGHCHAGVTKNTTCVMCAEVTHEWMEEQRSMYMRGQLE